MSISFVYIKYFITQNPIVYVVDISGIESLPIVYITEADRYKLPSIFSILYLSIPWHFPFVSFRAAVRNLMQLGCCNTPPSAGGCLGTLSALIMPALFLHVALRAGIDDSLTHSMKDIPIKNENTVLYNLKLTGRRTFLNDVSSVKGIFYRGTSLAFL